MCPTLNEPVLLRDTQKDNKDSVVVGASVMGGNKKTLATTVISDVVYKNRDLTNCVGQILLDYGFDNWRVVIDQRIRPYQMAVFTPQFISIKEAFEQLAAAYSAVLEINEESQTVQFTYNPQLVR